MKIETPTRIPQILDLLSAAEREVGEFFGALAPDELVLRVGDAWTPAEHLDHLRIATSAAAKAYAAPRWLLRLRFRRAREPSRSYDALRSDYRARLAQGGRATGRYVPQPDTTTAADAFVRRTMLLSRWYHANERLQNGIRSWSEPALDRTRVPHPLLGRITMRELALWTAYHDRHHIDAAKRRLPRFSAMPDQR